ncbi:MAG: hypothetical protein ACR2JP_03100 [Acidimicrobiia bacterium]
MTDPDRDPDGRADAAYQALLALHDAAGTFGDAHPGPERGLGPVPVGEALAQLAEAPEDQVSFGARLDVLHALAGADFPGYDEHEAEYVRLAESIGAPHGVNAQTILDDVKASAAGDTPFAATPTARALPHEATAFVGEDVCHTARVTVDGKPATWIFSEFETDASYQDLAAWVDPRSWPDRSPMLFKRMELIGGRTEVTGLDAQQHWHGEFLEEVQLVDRLRTLLHCDIYSRQGRAAGMTYNLTFSVGDQIIVDRGFLLATDIGDGLHRVKALKIVGFKESEWNALARFVCPLWTDFVRQATKGGKKSKPTDPSEQPTPPGSGPSPGMPLPGDELLDEWVDFFGGAAKTYAHLVGDVARKAVAGGYRAPDMAKDGARYWSQLAKDWSRAWAYGIELIQDIAEEGTDLAPKPPDPDRSWRSRPGAEERTYATAAAATTRTGEPEGTTIPIPTLTAGATVTSSDLVSIEAGAASIPAAAVTVTRTTLADGTAAVRVAAEGGDHPAGLYVGMLAADGQPVPLQIYLSRAVHGTP